ncbi:MAG: glycosyltransferase family 4 protein, partial [Patescibacteria group bacterium]
AVKGAMMITPVSGDTRAWFTQLFGRGFDYKLRTQPGGVDVNLFPKCLDTSMIERRYKLKGKNVVMFAGRLTPQKGTQYLIRAARKIKGEVFIVGDGSERKKLEKLARELKLKNIHFLGYFGRRHTRELKEFYYRSDVFVAPSVWEEPLGLVILEAMVCETPVVVTRKGGIPLAVKDKVNGLFVRARNSDDIAEKVNYLLDNPQMSVKMGKMARQIVLEKFNWTNIARRFERIYIEMAPPTNGNNKK